MILDCAVSKLEVCKWKPKVFVLIYYISGNGAKDRVMVWYQDYKKEKLRELLHFFCAPTQKIESAIDHELPTQFFLNEINFDFIKFENNQYGFDTVKKHYRGKNGHNDEASETGQLHF